MEEITMITTYMGLIKGKTYRLKHNHWPKGTTDKVVIKDFKPTYGDDSDVKIFHPRYGFYWVNHTQLEYL